MTTDKREAEIRERADDYLAAMRNAVALAAEAIEKPIMEQAEHNIRHLLDQLATLRQSLSAAEAERDRLKTAADNWAALARQAGAESTDYQQRIAALLAVQTWQPIETAPKDGTPILLGYFLEAGGGGEPCVARWHDWKNAWCDGYRLLNASGYFSPTHWMHLPPAARASD